MQRWLMFAAGFLCMPVTFFAWYGFITLKEEIFRNQMEEQEQDDTEC